jgi:type IV pilus assembly protein PilV
MNIARSKGTAVSRSIARGAQEGVVLLEALVSIVIFTLGIIALMGMQTASIQQVAQSKYRTDASYLANQLIGRIWMDQTTLTGYASPSDTRRTSWDAAVRATLPQGAGAVSVNGRIVTVTVTWQQPSESSSHNFVAVATINPS